jgi:SanA protein
VPRLFPRQLPLLIACGSLATFAVALPRLLLGWRYSQRIFLTDTAPAAPAAIVFGAGLTRDGRPTIVLADRVRTAVELYRLGKVETILMSGSAPAVGYSEPEAMRRLALSLGVPAQVLKVDPGGTRTYATCLRAKELFGIDRALLVSQAFHLPRALLTCHALGMRAEGVSADLRVYRTQALSFWRIREVPATWVALWEAYVARPSTSSRPTGESLASPIGVGDGT